MRIRLILIILLCISGCGYRDRSFDTLYLRLKKDITTLDPAFIVDVDGGRIASYLFNGLVRLNNELEVIPDIACRWDITDNGKRYRFYLRNDVVFSDGKRLTASDVKKSFERIIDPDVGSPRSWIFEKVLGCEEFLSGNKKSVDGFVVVDDYTFDIVLTEPFCPFLAILTSTNALIAGGRVADSVMAGTGPFVVSGWIRGDSLVLKRNGAYFGSKPKLDKIRFRIIPEDFTAITEFENGKLDILQVPRAEFEYFTHDKRWRDHVYSTTVLNTYYLGFNCQRYPFSDKAVRRAIAYAVDIDSIIEKYLSNRVTRASTPVPPVLIDDSIDISSPVSYNPQQAMRLLDESGVDRRQLSVSLYLSSNKEMEGVAELIQHNLKKIGVNVNINQLEWTAFKEKVAQGEADMFLLSWWADYPDIENFLYPVFYSKNWGAAGNRARYSNKLFDRIIEKARRSTDKSVRNKEYEQLLNIIQDDMPWVCLWHKKKFMVTQPWVKNYVPPPVYSVDKGTDIEIEHDR